MSGADNFTARLCNDSSKCDSPPSPSWADYAQLICFIISACIGIPLNIRAVSTLLAARKRSHSVGPGCTRSTGSFTLLCIHVCLANLLILAFYCLANVLWLSLWSWRADVFTCRLFRFSAPFGFHLLSNLVVAVALHVASSIYNPLWSRMSGTLHVKVLTMCSWLLALALSFPNLLMWTVAIPFEGYDYKQCVNSLVLSENSTSVMWYEAGHLATVFWLPLLILCPTYLYITIRTRSFLERSRLGQPKLEMPAKNRLTAGNSLRFFTSFRNGTGVSHCERTASQARSRAVPVSKKRKVVQTSLKIIASYVICWLPYQIICLWKTFFNDSFGNYYIYVDWLEVLVTLHACFNHLIYQREACEQARSAGSLSAKSERSMTSGNFGDRDVSCALVSHAVATDSVL